MVTDHVYAHSHQPHVARLLCLQMDLQHNVFVVETDYRYRGYKVISNMRVSMYQIHMVH